MSPPRGDVAVVGMACIFPQAPNLGVFWENILGRVDAITDPPSDWGGDLVFDPDTDSNDRIYTKRGGFLAELSRFNPLEYGVMPKEVEGGEPEHFLALRVAHEALSDAGYMNRPFPRERTQVILGRGTYVNRGYVSILQHGLVVDQTIRILASLHPEHTQEELESLRAQLKASLPPFNAETAPSLAHSVMCGRIANRLDLMGSAYTVDAACASSLIAVDLGIKDLLSGNADLVLAGGVQVSTTFPISQLFCQLGALSRKGQLRPFHAEADGTLLGEGVGVVVLKRLEDAQRDRDRVYAIVKSLGIASDGKAMGVLAPRVEGEELAMQRAYQARGISPRSVGLMEAHGTGTPVGDATEIEALARVFGGRNGDWPSCALGSVKSMIGHCIPAAGVAGFIKAALALHHKVIPPTLHCDTPNPKLHRTPFYLNTETRPWIHAGPVPRRAAVSSFGFGGINAHAVLEEAPEEASFNLHARWDCEVFILAADSREDLARRGNQLRCVLAGNPSFALHELAYALNGSVTENLTVRLSIVAGSFSELDKKLDFALERLSNPNTKRIKERSGIYYFEAPAGCDGKLAFLFPGEGSQYPGMLGDLCIHFPQCRGWFELMDRAFLNHPRGFVPSQIIFPPEISNPDERENLSHRLWNMDIAIETVFTANQALCSLLMDLGLRPSAVVGHSTGEYSALLVSGAIQLDSQTELIQCILDGNQITERSIRAGLVPERSLLAVGPANLDHVHRLLQAANGSLYLAMDNCPHQAVLCGTEQAIASAHNELRAEGVICQPLPFGRAYHTPLFAPVCAELRKFYQQLTFVAPQITVYSCAIAAPFPKDPEEARVVAEEQWVRPVRFRETIEAMYADGVRTFIEAGPRGNLIAFVEDILAKRNYLAVAANVARRSGLSQINHLVGLLAAHGIPLNLDPLYARRASRLDSEAILQGEVSKPTEKSMHLSLALPTLELTRAHSSSSRLSKLEHPIPAQDPGPVDSPGPASERQSMPNLGTAPLHIDPVQQAHPQATTAVVAEFLQTMEHFLEVQQSIVSSFLENGLEFESGFQNGHAHAQPTTEVDALSISFPFIGKLTKREIGKEAITLRELNMDEDIFLHHHALGPRISEIDPNLLPLPVLPLAVSVEMMTEAASLVVPGMRPRELRNVRAHRWVALQTPRLLLETVARLNTDNPNQVKVEIRTAGPGPPVEGGGVVLVEGSVCFGEPDRSPRAEHFRLQSKRPSAWTPDQLYASGQRHGMFHGSTFQGVVSVDWVGSNGAEATLRALSAAGMFQSKSRSAFLTDPLLVDAAGQVVGFWAADWLDRASVVFPVGFESMYMYGAALHSQQRLTCRVQITELEEARLRANLDLFDVSGQVLLRILGWEVKRYDLPERFYSFRLSPAEAFASVPWPEPLQSLSPQERFECCRVEFPADFLEADAAIWRECLAHLVLSRQERNAWQDIGKSEQRRTEWLLGRLAAKDAIRLLVKKRCGTRLYPADIEILAANNGQPMVRVNCSRNIPSTLLVSIAHSDGTAAAIATDEPTCCGVGIDIEHQVERGEGLKIAGFTRGELALLSSLDPALKSEWLLRVWCAKESVAKALQWGMSAGPNALVAQEIDLQTGAVKLAVSDALASHFPEMNGALLSAYTKRETNLIFSSAHVKRN
jgi:acyl transferase domain-containing protein/4'-phosphopantetheinyl transferase EntD